MRVELTRTRSNSVRIWDILFLLAGIGLLLLFTVHYQMPFRLDDVLLMEWANAHAPWQAFDPVQGQIVNSVRPLFALTAWILTHTAGATHPFWWHLTLALSLLIGIAFTGLTARYISGRSYSLQIAILLYFLAFTTILNVFFWYSDLTYGLELCFTASTWYFGVRALLEGKLPMWITAMVLGILAVLSKEPAIVLVHVVLLGTLAMRFTQVRSVWSAKRDVIRASLAYMCLIAVTVYIVAISPTRSNRFFSLSTPDLGYFISDRIRFYSEILFSLSARVLLFFPITYVALRSVFRARFGADRVITLLGLAVVSIVLSLLVFQNMAIGLPITAVILLILAVVPNSEINAVRQLIPFVLSLLIAGATLLVTIQLVKTQLTEIAMLMIVVSSWAWCVLIEDAIAAVRPFWQRRAVRVTLIGGISVLIVAGIAGATPKLLKEERLLRNVRDVRRNANDAIQWSATHLPRGSLFAVTSYSLHGIEHGDELTGKDDETKLRDQYTFVGGYVYIYLEQLGRRDIQHAYLADTTLLPRVLSAMRSQPNSYLFLQTELDLQRFHDPTHPLLTARDSLVAQFSRGPYPTEIWLLRP